MPEPKIIIGLNLKQDHIRREHHLSWLQLMKHNLWF